jgi:superfamily II DNA or RNA helicase
LSEQEKGKYFEELTYLILTTKPVYTSLLKNVWIHGKGMPSSIAKKLNLPRTDEGIDLIAETYSGQYWAIQCKFKGANQSPTYKELSTFTHLAHTHCKNISMALLVHTGERGVRKKHLLGDKYSEIGLEFWLELTEEDWQRIWLKKAKKTVTPQKRLPKPHQIKAISSAHTHFIKKGNSMGRLIMPCGTGKSLTAFWIANKVKAKSVIVAVPSLNLIKQSLEDWTKEFSAIGEQNKVDWKIICSDESVRGVESDEFVTDTASLGVPTTDVSELTKFLKQPSKGKKVVFTTYQSSQRLAAAAKKSKFVFDFAILDEAHKTVGEKSKAFAILLSDKNIKIRQRMFMTATERVLRGKNDDVHSMDDVQVYGERFYQLTFKEAIHSKPGIISDYKILTIAITNSQIKELLQKNPLLTDKRGKISDQEAQSLAAAIALRQATKKYGIKHAISFHRSIKTADKFASLHQELNSKKANGINLTSFHISSKKSTGERSRLIDDFKSESLALMTNARCLTEGVNIPAIDCVLFADPKQSVVDIVQAAGRALRVSKGKKYGYIMMPIVVPDNMSIEEFTETTPFKKVARIITALSTQDERIVEELKVKSQRKSVRDGMLEFSGDIESVLSLNMSQFIESIESSIWERVGKANWIPYDDARKYVKNIGIKSYSEWIKFRNTDARPKDIPSDPSRIYKHTGWENWGHFFGTDTIASYYKIFRPYDEAIKYTHTLNLKSQRYWFDYCRAGAKPDDIPTNPQTAYKNNGWVSWGMWLGTKKVADQLVVFRDFKSARNFVHSLKLKSREDWKKYCRSGKKPDDIPVNALQTYKNKGWAGWGDWLGTGRIQDQLRIFRPFTEARTFVRKLGFKGVKDWKSFCKSGEKPDDIPANAALVYRDEGWMGWGDWLGTERVASSQMAFYCLSYLAARAKIHKLQLKTQKDWRLFCKSGLKPPTIPSNPAYFYRESGWISWRDWLGTELPSKGSKFVPFEDASQFVKKLKLNSKNEWYNYCKSGLKPENIPTNPSETYKNNGWKGWPDFLGKK